MSYSRSKSRVLATGDVLAVYGNRRLRADTVYYNRSKGILNAFGAVRVESPTSNVITTRAFGLHLPSNRIQFSKLKARYGNWYMSGPTLVGDADTELLLKNGQLTNCNLSPPHYHLGSGHTKLYPGESFVSWNNVVYVWGVPIFYFPYLNISLRDHVSRWEIRPGYDSQTGTELVVNYHYLLPSDTGPVTSTIYTDYREDGGAGGGFDIGYDQPGKQLYFYTFLANRRPTFLDEAGNKVRADTEETLWRVQSQSNYNFGETNWKFQSNVDWLDSNRFNDDFQSTVGGRGSFERKINNSLMYTGEHSIFRIDAIREDKVVEGRGRDFFQFGREILPRIQYQLFSVPFDVLGQNLFYSSNARVERGHDEPDGENLTEASVSQSVSKSFSLTKRWGQDYRIGYEQELAENSSRKGGNRSVGIGSFGLTNSYRPNQHSTVSLRYDLVKQINQENQVPFDLAGVSLGTESNGLLNHRLDLTYQWRRRSFSGSLRTGYDLRHSDTKTVESDSRVISPQLNFNTRLTPRINWNQYLRYNYATNSLVQSNSTLEFDWNPRLNFSLGANYNRKPGDDFLKLKNSFRWNSQNGKWGLSGDIIYDQAQSEFEEINLAFRKQFHEWNFRIYFRSLHDGDKQVFFTFSLADFPSRAVGLSADIEDHGFSLEQGNTSQYKP